MREIRAELAERGVEVKALSTIADMLPRCRPSAPPLAGVAALY